MVKSSCISNRNLEFGWEDHLRSFHFFWLEEYVDQVVFKLISFPFYILESQKVGRSNEEYWRLASHISLMELCLRPYVSLHCSYCFISILIVLISDLFEGINKCSSFILLYSLFPSSNKLHSPCLSCLFSLFVATRFDKYCKQHLEQRWIIIVEHRKVRCL